MITIAVERTTKVSPGFLMDQIWSGLEWRSTGSGVKGLAIEYDDGRHQSVQICIDWKPSYLAMSILRFREDTSRISFFYSLLPPGLVKQTGVWEARATEAGSSLRLVRHLQFQRGRMESEASLQEREDAFGLLLKDRLGLSLDAVTQHSLRSSSGWTAS